MKRLVLTLTVLAVMPGSTPASAAGPLEADHVVAAVIPGGSQWGFSLWCEAAGWRQGAAFDDVIVGEGAIFDDPTGRAMSGTVYTIGDIRSSRGTAVVIGDATVVSETVEDPRYRIVAFGIGVGGFGLALREPVAMLFSVAAWGAEPVCEVDQGGPIYELERQEGARAFYAGPYAFAGGAHVQELRDQVAAGRSFATDLPGGPTIGYLQTGHVSGGTVGIAGAESWASASACGPATWRRDGCTVTAGSYGGDRIVAAVPASWSLGGWDLGLYVISLAAEPEVTR